MIDPREIKHDFPILKIKINGKRLVYLDSAATSQRPRQVMDAVREFWGSKNANVARSLHALAEAATEEYENARKKSAEFIGANEDEIIFVRNTTEAINLVMSGWGKKFVGKDDTIVTTIMEHHSNFVPWQQLAKEKSARFEIIDIDREGKLREEALERMGRAKIVAITMASNVLGTVNDIKKICKMARKNGAVTVVDAAQAVPGMPVNVKELECDFLAFSGHKMLAPFGIGVLYGRKEMLEQMSPFLYGSEMATKVSIEKSEWNELPHRFEAGTPPVDAAVGLSAAIDYLEKIGMENVRKHELRLVREAIEVLEDLGMKVLGPKEPSERTGLVAFSIDGVHPHDVATLLDREGIAIRSGHHCAMPLHVRLGLPQGSNRISFYIYNTPDDIIALERAIKKIKQLFR
ncbi:MAG: SufS family cysteine desulfurase [Candidatus Bilamarchaeaceae archaeon]